MQEISILNLQIPCRASMLEVIDIFTGTREPASSGEQLSDIAIMLVGEVGVPSLGVLHFARTSGTEVVRLVGSASDRTGVKNFLLGHQIN